MHLIQETWKTFQDNPKLCVFKIIRRSGFLKFISDEKYLRYQFKATIGYPLNLENPQTYTEKLQWLKLYDRNPRYTKMVDKLEAKKYVNNVLGGGYTIPTLGVYKSFDEIDFDKLPEQFVLKCTHDSGGVFVCRDKKMFCIEKVKRQIRKRLKINYYLPCREWPYKDVKPRIIVEKYMSNNGKTVLSDYKFYCFQGIPRFLYVSEGMENHHTAKISYVTLDWERLPFRRTDYMEFDILPPKPEHLKEMIKIAQVLAEGTHFVRVDLYQINERIYFSEFTFFPGGGFTQIEPAEYIYEIGNLIKL